MTTLLDTFHFGKTQYIKTKPFSLIEKIKTTQVINGIRTDATKGECES